jgi:hypothetical protein
MGLYTSTFTGAIRITSSALPIDEVPKDKHIALKNDSFMKKKGCNEMEMGPGDCLG